MRLQTTSSLLHFFGDTLWNDSVLGRRSTEITPLYVDRYRGPRHPRSLTAHPFWELTATVGGSGHLVATSEVLLKAGVVCLIPRKVPHDERGDSQLDTIWIGFEWPVAPGAVQRWRGLQAVNSHALAKFTEHLWIFSKQQGGRIGPELDGMTAMAVGWFLRLWSEGAPGTEEDLVERAVRHFDQHFAEPISIPAVARRFGCSEGYFHRVFKRRTGSPPVVYLTRLRVRHAARLLEHTRLSVAEIAALVGYDNPFYFTRVFARITGAPPTGFREQMSGGNYTPRKRSASSVPK